MSTSWKAMTVRELAARVGQVLHKHHLEAILVGGACVSIYSQNKYVSKDLDLITYAPLTQVKEALRDLGFAQKSGRHFTRKDCPFYLEFIPPPVAIGDQPITVFKELRTPLGRIKLLTPSDCVKDRLAAFFYWDDYQSLNQAFLVAKKHKINWRNVRLWAHKEHQLVKYRRFLAQLKKDRNNG